MQPFEAQAAGGAGCAGKSRTIEDVFWGDRPQGGGAKTGCGGLWLDGQGRIAPSSLRVRDCHRMAETARGALATKARPALLPGRPLADFVTGGPISVRLVKRDRKYEDDCSHS